MQSGAHNRAERGSARKSERETPDVWGYVRDTGSG